MKLFVEQLWQVNFKFVIFSGEIPVGNERRSRWMSVCAVMLALDFYIFGIFEVHNR